VTPQIVRRAGSLILIDIPESLASGLRDVQDKFVRRQSLVLIYTHNLSDPHHLAFTSFSDPVLWIGTIGNYLFVGPFQKKAGSVCLRCLQHWLRGSRTSSEERVAPITSREAEWLLGFLRKSIAQFYRMGTVSEIERSFVSLCRNTKKQHRHFVVSLRDCACYEPKLCLPLKAHLSPLIGLVWRLSRTSRPIAGIYHAYANFITPPGTLSATTAAERTSWGRGIAISEAENSCVGEAIEAYSLIHRGDEKTIQARPFEIDGIDPRQILLFSNRQYGMRNEYNGKSARYYVPEPYDDRQPIEWLRGIALASGRQIWVPAACCLTHYRFANGRAHFARMDASGTASGRTFSDALLSALHESIERDALAIWWYNRVRRPQVRLSLLENSSLRKITKAFDRLGRSLLVLDITTDLQIPAYVAVTADRDGRKPVFASCAHIMPRVAIERAITEAALNWFIASKNPMDEGIREWFKTARLAEHTYLMPLGYSCPPTESAATSDQQVDVLIGRLVQAGLSPVAVDLTRNDTMLTTVRAVVPGLRTFTPTLAAGRLYDLPVQLGWQKKRLDEHELNPVCVF
jgi:thiazole/oxazole-forming peptide maturase SagD family component